MCGFLVYISFVVASTKDVNITGSEKKWQCNTIRTIENIRINNSLFSCSIYTQKCHQPKKMNQMQNEATALFAKTNSLPCPCTNCKQLNNNNNKVKWQRKRSKWQYYTHDYKLNRNKVTAEVEASLLHHFMCNFIRNWCHSLPPPAPSASAADLFSTILFICCDQKFQEAFLFTHSAYKMYHQKSKLDDRKYPFHRWMREEFFFLYFVFCVFRCCLLYLLFAFTLLFASHYQTKHTKRFIYLYTNTKID